MGGCGGVAGAPAGATPPGVAGCGGRIGEIIRVYSPGPEGGGGATGADGCGWEKIRVAPELAGGAMVLEVAKGEGVGGAFGGVLMAGDCEKNCVELPDEAGGVAGLGAANGSSGGASGVLCAFMLNSLVNSPCWGADVCPGNGSFFAKGVAACEDGCAFCGF